MSLTAGARAIHDVSTALNAEALRAELQTRVNREGDLEALGELDEAWAEARAQRDWLVGLVRKVYEREDGVSE